MSPDARPLLGPVPGVDGLVVATGLGPTGLTMGPYAGAIAARVALGEPPGVDLAPFNPLRAILRNGPAAGRGLSAASSVEFPGDDAGGHGARRRCASCRDAHVHVARGDLAAHGVGGAGRAARAWPAPSVRATLTCRGAAANVAPRCPDVIVACQRGRAQSGRADVDAAGGYPQRPGQAGDDDVAGRLAQHDRGAPGTTSRQCAVHGLAAAQR